MKQSFSFHKEWWDNIMDLPEQFHKEAYEAIFTYAFTGRLPLLEEAVVRTVKPICAELDGRIGKDPSLRQLKETFEIFRKNYPGVKRGLDVEFAHFRKKYPNDWKDIVPLLAPALENMKRYRAEALGMRAFVPECPMLQTWINQARWTVEYPTIASKETSYERDYSDTDFGGIDY